MKRALLITVGSALLAGSAVCQDPQTPPPSAHWPEFLQKHEGPWQARWNKATQTPNAVFGPGLRLDPGPTDGIDDARRRADRVLRQYEKLLGLGTSSFREEIGQHVAQTWVFVFQQSYRDLEVIGGRADVRVHDNGAISMFGSRAVQIPADFEVVPTIGDALAIARAHERAGTDANAKSAARLVVHADVLQALPTVPRLAWQVDLDANTPFVRATVFVDARDGSILEYRNRVVMCRFGHEHVIPSRADRDAELDTRLELGRSLRTRRAGPGTVTGTVVGYMNTSGIGGAAPTNQPIPNLLVSVDNGGSAFTDDNGAFTIGVTGAGPFTVRANLGLNRSHHAGGGVFTYDGNGDPFCFPGTPGCNPNPPVVPGQAVTASAQAMPGGPAVVLQLAPTQAQFDVSQVTSYWHVDDVNRYLRGILGDTGQLNTLSNVAVFNNWGADCNAFYDSNQIHFFSAGSGCVNTAFQSIVYHEWGHGLDDVYGGIARSQGQQVQGMSEAWADVVAMYRSGQSVIGQGFGISGGIRDGANGASYPPSPAAGPHTQGLSFMGWGWDVRTGLRGSLGAGPGTALAEQIVLGSIVADGSTQPDCVLEVFLLDDDDADLTNGTPNYDILSSTATARNLPFPERVPGIVTHAALGHTDEVLKPRVVRVQAVPFFGSFAAVDVYWDVNGGAPLVRRATTTSVPNEYLALLPGVGTPDFVNYYIRATHSTGEVIRLPRSGTFTYVVGQPVELLSASFEGANDNGWTHALIANQDDWQRDVPDGDNGDPSFAPDGNNVWGNDLGHAPWNGAYQNNTENWLRSPLVDASASGGVFVEFQRWLTIESAQFDQAEVRAEGHNAAWTNPLLDDLIDTSWSLQRVRIPELDNTTGRVEWRLRSDPGLVFGGWTIDDVRIMRTDPAPMPSITFTATPPQIPAMGNSQLEVQGFPSAPAALLLSAQPGPTPVFPGLVLEVGPTFVAIPISVDATGHFSNSIPGSRNGGLAGRLLYSQVIQISTGGIGGSNGMIFLMTN